jgi:hypothetical protein
VCLGWMGGFGASVLLGGGDEFCGGVLIEGREEGIKRVLVMMMGALFDTFLVARSSCGM